MAAIDEMRRKNTFSPLVQRAIETALANYQFNEINFLRLLKNSDQYSHIRRKISVNELEKNSEQFKDELEEFSFVIKTDYTYSQTSGKKIKYFLSNIILNLTVLLSDYDHYWDKEMTEVIHNHLVKYKYLYNFIEKDEI